MADMFTGTVAPSVDTTKTSTTTAPTAYTNYLSNLAQAGTSALGVSPEQLVAPLTAMQQQGYAAVPTAAESYKPQLTAAQQTAGGVAAGITPEKINQFMNPYTQNVVDEMGRLQQQNIQRNVMPQLKAGFVGSGGLGSQRYANATGQTMADMQSNLTGQQYGALSSGFQNAIQNAINEGQMQTQAGQLQSQLAGQEQQLGLTGAGAMTKAGAEQQAFEQAKIDAPLKQATNAAALMRGYQVPTSVTETFHGPMAGVYGTSPLAQIAGLGSLFGSAFNTPTGGGVPYGKQFMDWVLSKMPSASASTPTPDGGTIDANGNPIYGGGAVVNDPLGGDYGSVYDSSPDTSDIANAWEDYYNSLGDTNNAYYSDYPVEP